MNQAIFFDRDGVLNELISRDDGYFSPRELHHFNIRKGIVETLKKLKDDGYLNIVVSNQPDISRGLLSIDELEKMTKKLNDELMIDDVLYCIHDDLDYCRCRKPKPGLILKAAEKWNIDLTRSFLIGDTSKDIEAAINANINYFLLENNFNMDEPYGNRIKEIDDIFSLIDG